MLPPGAIAFIGGAGGFCFLLVIFFLYITKKACFSGAKGCACCADEVEGDRLESESESEDSEDEIKDIYRKSMRRKKEKRTTKGGYSPVPSDDPEAGTQYGALSAKQSTVSLSTPKGGSNSNRAQSRASAETVLRSPSAAPSIAPSTAARSDRPRSRGESAAASVKTGEIPLAAAASSLSLTALPVLLLSFDISGYLSGRGSPANAVEEADVAIVSFVFRDLRKLHAMSSRLRLS